MNLSLPHLILGEKQLFSELKREILTNQKRSQVCDGEVTPAAKLEVLKN